MDKVLHADTINKNIWHKNCPASLDRMKLLHINYVNFEGNKCDDGLIVVFDVVAKHVKNIFEELKEIRFPIAKIRLINDYSGSDDKSMEDNNSSAFNCRHIHGTNRYSIHSYGMAIDVNPLQNPIVYNDTNPPTFQPTGGAEYLDRSKTRPGMITPKVISIFKKHGFTVWGGAWTTLYDYHHFEVPREICEKLANMSYEDGIKLFEQHRNGI